MANTKKYELVVCIVNAGYSQNVMESARAAGAKGGNQAMGKTKGGSIQRYI